MDRGTPSDLDQVSDGGQQIKEAFFSMDAFQ